MSILIEEVLLNGKRRNILIEGKHIVSLDARKSADIVIDGRNKAAIPGLINTHTHAAMSLFRGYADDMRLHDWLSSKIWPLEQSLKPEHIYWGTKLACLEMIKSGTTCFNDMYFFMEEAARAAEDMGMRAVLGEGFVDSMNPDVGKREFSKSVRLVESILSMKNDRIIPALGPHAIYTVSSESLQIVSEYAEKKDLLIHFHLSETEEEVNSCVERYGKRPVEFLEDIGFLSPRLIAAHSVWLNRKEIETLRKHDVKVSYNPVSNMKLAVGRAMPYEEMREAGVLVSLGTDGCASNNSLDMLETMKFAALYQKAFVGDPTILPAKDVVDLAAENGAKTLGLDAGGIAPGKLADLVLIDLKMPQFQPGHNIISDLVYSATGACVDTVICDGRTLMRDRTVEGEEEILNKAREAATDLVGESRT
ncbi:MAG: amidohydrolase [Thermoplasmata archaeon]